MWCTVRLTGKVVSQRKATWRLFELYCSALAPPFIYSLPLTDIPWPYTLLYIMEYLAVCNKIWLWRRTVHWTWGHKVFYPRHYLVGRVVYIFRSFIRRFLSKVAVRRTPLAFAPHSHRWIKLTRRGSRRVICTPRCLSTITESASDWPGLQLLVSNSLTFLTHSGFV